MEIECAIREKIAIHAPANDDGTPGEFVAWMVEYVYSDATGTRSGNMRIDKPENAKDATLINVIKAGYA